MSILPCAIALAVRLTVLFCVAHQYDAHVQFLRAGVVLARAGESSDYGGGQRDGKPYYSIDIMCVFLFISFDRMID